MKNRYKILLCGLVVVSLFSFVACKKNTNATVVSGGGTTEAVTADEMTQEAMTVEESSVANKATETVDESGVTNIVEKDHAWSGVFKNGDMSVELLPADGSNVEVTFSDDFIVVVNVNGNNAVYDGENGYKMELNMKGDTLTITESGNNSYSDKSYAGTYEYAK